MDQLQNAHGISRDQAERIEEDLSLLDEERQGLAGEVLGYVFRGENEQVLAELEASREVFKHLRLICSGRLHYQEQAIRETRLEILRHWETGDGVVPHRLGRVLLAGLLGMKQLYLQGTEVGDLQWLGVLLKEGSGWGMNKNDKVLAANVDWAVADFEKMVIGAGGGAQDLVRFAVLGVNAYSLPLKTVKGLPEWLVGWVDEILHIMGSPEEATSESAWSAIRTYGIPLEGELLRRTVERALGGSTRKRKGGASLLEKQAVDSKEVQEVIRHYAEKGKATERRHAVALILRLLGEEAVPYLQERLEQEKTKSVREEIELAVQSFGHGGGEGRAYAIPEPRKFDGRVELTSAMVTDLRERIEKVNEAEIRLHAENWDRQDPRWRQGDREIPTPIEEVMIEATLEALRSSDRCREGGQLYPDGTIARASEKRRALMEEFLVEHQLGWVARLRMMWVEELFHWRYSYFWHRGVEPLQRGLARDPGMTMIDLAEAFEVAGLGEDLLMSYYLEPGSSDLQWNPLELPDEAIWPLFARRIDALEKSLGIGVVGGGDGWHGDLARERAFRILGLFPWVPEHLAPKIWEVALAGGKGERLHAQRCLSREEGRDEKIIAALGDRRKGVRQVAAEWLGRLKVVAAEKALGKAVVKEKADEVKAEMMATLERFGVDVDRFLDRKALLAEAEKGLKKALPKSVEWFPFAELPVVHWEKSGEVVAPEVLKWMLVQAVKIKKPEPGPLLRRYVRMMDREERKALGGVVLNHWLLKDVPPGTKPGGQWEPGYEPASAIDCKGLLAMAAAACEEEILPIVSTYLKTWYGWRPAQCKALLRVVSWIETPVAVQYLFEISNRFRTRSIQKEAAAIIEEVAERNGWTRGELADRTVPSGGFDEMGYQEIDYGTRRFSARLMEDLSIELKTEEGKVIKTLPAARVNEEADEVKVHKSAFTKAKKEIKQAARMLEERLYEAMCLERRWLFSDWEIFLHRHPLAGRFCQRLVWMAYRDGERVATFRPLADRTLSDVEDNEVKLEPGDELQLAHTSFLTSEEGAAWLQHFEDYEVPELFTQFGQLAFEMDEDRKKAQELRDFEGHMIDAYPLRRIAKKLGYRRGPSEDGGWFHTYERPFPGLKMQAVLEMSGNRLPEDDEEVALLGVSVVSVNDEEDAPGRRVRLGDLPEVLVGELWNDFRMIAAEGRGFDSGWRKEIGG